jgi:uncharacterized protein
MKLHAHPAIDRTISHITPNSLSVAGLTYNTSIQISKNNGVSLWLLQSIEQITEIDINNWTVQKPELIILGSGNTHRFLSAQWCVKLFQFGIGIECMNTAAAARTYNVLLDEGRNVLGAFILD